MVLRELGGPVRLEEVPIPKIGPNDVLIRVRATGVGLTVVIMTATPGRVTAYPRIPGHEVAGEGAGVCPEHGGTPAGDRGPAPRGAPAPGAAIGPDPISPPWPPCREEARI